MNCCCKIFWSILGASSSKRPRLESQFEEGIVDGDLVARVSRFALYYLKGDNFKRSAIPLTQRLAMTFRHGENANIKQNEEIRIRSLHDNDFDVPTRVVRIIEELDAIILESRGKDLCDKDLVSGAVEPLKGMRYLLVIFYYCIYYLKQNIRASSLKVEWFQMGFSIMHGQGNHQSLSMGIISSDITPRLRFVGSSGSFKGDSGGSCWNDNGNLIGMQVEVEKVAHTTDKKGQPACPASGGRYYIVSITSIRAHILVILIYFHIIQPIFDFRICCQQSRKPVITTNKPNVIPQLNYVFIFKVIVQLNAKHLADSVNKPYTVILDMVMRSKCLPQVIRKLKSVLFICPASSKMRKIHC